MNDLKQKEAGEPGRYRLIDTHTHLYFEDAYPDGGCADAVRRAIDVGVDFMIFPGINLEAMEGMERLQQLFPDNTALTAGVHPDDLTDDWKTQLAEVRDRMKKSQYIAIGEIGIDLYRDATFVERQKEAFEEQLKWAVEDRLPIVIHCREGLEETLEVLGKFSREELPRILFHCFTGTPEQVKRIREVLPHAMFAVNGVVTFKNAAEVRESVKEIGIDHLVLETDSPYLAPVPFRGKRNESAYIPVIAEAVARVLDTDADTIARITTANAVRFFGL